MDAFIFIIFVIGIPVMIAVLIILSILDAIKRSQNWFKTIPIAILIFIIYIIWGPFFPDRNFDKSEYEKIIGLDFTKDSRVLYKKASFPDSHGERTSVALIQISEDTYQELLKMAKKIKSDSLFINSDCFEWIEKKNGGGFDFEAKVMKYRREIHFTFWGLIKKERRLVIYLID